MKDLCLAVTKVFTVGPGRRTKMAAMPIYKKTNFKKLLLLMTLKLSTQQEGLQPSKTYDYNTVPQM